MTTQHKSDRRKPLETQVKGNVHVDGQVSIELMPKEKADRRASEEKQDAKDLKKWRLEISTFGVIAIYAALTLWQGCSTQQIANLTREQFRKDQRAWVSLSDVQINKFEPGSPLDIKILFTNTGKTPAVAASFGNRGSLWILSSASESTVANYLAYSAANLPMIHKPPFAPQQTQEFSVSDDSSITQTALQQTKLGITRFYIEGRTEYKDVSGTQQWMSFCIVIFYDAAGLPKWGFCTTGNDLSYQN